MTLIELLQASSSRVMRDKCNAEDNDALYDKLEAIQDKIDEALELARKLLP